MAAGLVGGLAGSSTAWAQPAPVLSGLWEVQSLAIVEPPHANSAAQQARRYRICITAERARSPMLPRRMPAGTELVFDGQSYSGSFDGVRSAPGQQMEFTFRRLSAKAFEGSLDLRNDVRIQRLQYFAQHVGPDCAGTRPTWPRDSGQP